MLIDIIKWLNDCYENWNQLFQPRCALLDEINYVVKLQNISAADIGPTVDL